MVDEALLICGDGPDNARDITRFWRDSTLKEEGGSHDDQTRLEPDVVIALTKFFVLEWSNELDYQIYPDFLIEWIIV